MEAKKYPIGTAVIFIASKDMCSEARQDDGKIGKIVGKSWSGRAQVYLPNSVKIYGKYKTWCTNWKNVKPVLIKNQQLLFDFMSDD